MKRTKALFLPILSLAVLSLSSCTKNCCDCTGVAGLGSGSEVCESDYDATAQAAAGGLTWSEWRSAAITAGCDCN